MTLRRSLSMILIAMTAACSSKETAGSADSPVATTGLDQHATAPSSTMTLTAADLDGFVKGLKREIELVREGQIRASRATTALERGNAIQSTFEENTMKEAVPVSGLTFERYHLVRGTLGRLLTTLDFQGRIEGPQSVDTAMADSVMKARLASDPYSVLDPASADLLRSKLDTIAPLWVEYVKLTTSGTS